MLPEILLAVEFHSYDGLTREWNNLAIIPLASNVIGTRTAVVNIYCVNYQPLPRNRVN